MSVLIQLSIRCCFVSVLLDYLAQSGSPVRENTPDAATSMSLDGIMIIGGNCRSCHVGVSTTHTLCCGYDNCIDDRNYNC